jgi:flagellar basal body-associated protein FliL
MSTKDKTNEIISGCLTQSREKKCSNELENMSARDACAEMQRQHDELMQALEADRNNAQIWGDLLDALALAAVGGVIVASGGAAWILIPVALGVYGGKVADAISGGATSKATAITNIKQDFDSTTVVDQFNTCVDNVDADQSNIISIKDVENINAKCWDIVKKSGSVYSKDNPPPIVLENIKQINKLVIKQSCQINVLLDTLQAMESSISNQVLQQALNESKGLLSGKAESDQFTCNDISANINACTWIEQRNCCSGNISATQKNLIDTECPVWLINVTQENLAELEQSCKISVDMSISQDTKSSIDNKVIQKSVNKSTGIDLNILMIIALVLLLGGGGSLFLPSSGGGKSTGKSIMLIVIGIIFFIVSIALFIFYFSSKIPGYEAKNSPVSLCKNTKIQAPTSKTTYGEAQTKFENDNKIIGYDFFPDKDKDKQLVKPEDIQEDTTGVVVYITEYDPKDRDDKKCDPLQEATSITQIREQENKWILYVAIGVLVISIIQVTYGIYSYMSVKSQPEIQPKRYRIVNRKKDSPEGTRTDVGW